MLAEFIIFALLSAGLVYWSWEALHNPHIHGFFRFFVFEAILALILLNARLWFRDPFSVLQIISWLLLTSSLAMAIHGFHLLRAVGKPAAGIENTTVLVKQGAYRYIRHPLYCSLLLFAWGAFLKDISPFSIILVLLASAFLFMTARAEENENVERFGDEYASYLKTTRMFIPFLF